MDISYILLFVKVILTRNYLMFILLFILYSKYILWCSYYIFWCLYLIVVIKMFKIINTIDYIFLNHMYFKLHHQSIPYVQKLRQNCNGVHIFKKKESCSWVGLKLKHSFTERICLIMDDWQASCLVWFLDFRFCSSSSGSGLYILLFTYEGFFSISELWWCGRDIWM